MAYQRPYLRAALAALLMAGLYALCGWPQERHVSGGQTPASKPVTRQADVTTHPASAPTRPTTSSQSAPPSQPDMQRVRVLVSGRVQGVGFRDFTKAAADSLGVTGWVRNLADGRVEAVLEGPSDKVGRLVERIRRGPASARVDKVDLEQGTYAGEFKAFDVKR